LNQEILAIVVATQDIAENPTIIIRHMVIAIRADVSQIIINKC